MTINKVGRPLAAHGPLDASYTYRTNDELKTAFLAVAGPVELNKFMAWFTHAEDAELPERPPAPVKKAA